MNIVKKIAGFILMSGGLLFLIFRLLPTGINMVKDDLNLIGEHASNFAPVFLLVLFQWAFSIVPIGIVAMGVIL